MRKAIIVELKKITDFGNRVYQSYAAPATVSKPYCVAKMSGEYPMPSNKRGSMKDLQIFIYNTPGSFVSLDDLEVKVRKQLHAVTLSTDDSPARFFTCYYNMTQPDFYDDISSLLSIRVDFIIPLSRV